MTDEAPTWIRQHIPRGTRGAILKWFDRSGALPDEILEELQIREGFGDERDLIRHVRAAYGDREGERLKTEAGHEVDGAIRDRLGEFGMGLGLRHNRRGPRPGPSSRASSGAPPAAPDPLFACALEAACDR